MLPTGKFGRRRISEEKALLMTLYYLSKVATFRELSHKFNVTLSTAHRLVNLIVSYFSDHSEKYITWPQGTNLISTVKKFKSKIKIDKVIGVINNCHIHIKKPAKDSILYQNENNRFSVLLQVVSNVENQFTDVYCGEIGSLNPKSLLVKSSLKQRAVSGALKGHCLVGDSSYPSFDWLLTPIEDNGQLKEKQVYNDCILSGVSVVNDALNGLKCRFKHLEYFDNESVVFVKKCVTGCVVIHNICISVLDFYNFEEIDCVKT